jgi:DNA-binding NarL/FixJ family response regulator
MEQPLMLRVAVIDNQQVLIESFARIFKGEEDIELVWSTNKLAGSLNLFRHTSPDVLLLGVHLPDGNGLDIISDIEANSPNTKIIILTDLTDDYTIMRAIEHDVSGLITKSCSLSELLDVIRNVGEGEVSMPSEILIGLLKRSTDARNNIYNQNQLWERLTPREQEILKLLAQGKSGDRIATELEIAPLTVRTHIRNLMAKLGVHSRLEAVTYALSSGFIEI